MIFKNKGLLKQTSVMGIFLTIQNKIEFKICK